MREGEQNHETASKQHRVHIEYEKLHDTIHKLQSTIQKKSPYMTNIRIGNTIDSRERNRDRKPQVFTRSLRTPAGYRVFKRIQKFGI